jgi:hypothetical protein
MSNQYNKVVKDLKALPDVILFFEKQLEEAKFDTAIRGKSLERLEAELPGIVEHRFMQLQEIEAILEFMNIKTREVRSRAFKKFLEAYQKSLSSRDAERYADGDSDYVDMAIMTNEVALLRNKFLALHKGLEQKAWMMGHITRLKCAGLDDAKVE